MGLTSEVLALGPYSPSLLPVLDASPVYRRLAIGSPLVEPIFQACGSTMSRALAAVFDVDPWRFEQHALNVMGVDERFATFLSKNEGLCTAGDPLARLRAFRAHAFRFFFRTNG